MSLWLNWNIVHAAIKNTAYTFDYIILENNANCDGEQIEVEWLTGGSWMEAGCVFAEELCCCGPHSVCQYYRSEVRLQDTYCGLAPAISRTWIHSKRPDLAALCMGASPTKSWKQQGKHCYTQDLKLLKSHHTFEHEQYVPKFLFQRFFKLIF